MPFIVTEDQWVRSHVIDVVRDTMEFCGNPSVQRMLDVGCGEMLSDLGFLGANVGKVVGLDLYDYDPGHVERVANRIHLNGIDFPSDYAARVAYRSYDGRKFPFPDRTFDFVFSWSAMEHIHDVPAVLAEMARVLEPGGTGFIQVFPWWTSRHGSHLSDYIAEPFFHLRCDETWIRERLEGYIQDNPEKKDFVLDYMWKEFHTLNRYSAAKFLEDLRQSPFTIRKVELITYAEDLTGAPHDVPLLDLLVSGCKVLLGCG